MKLEKITLALIDNPFESNIAKYQKPVEPTGQPVLSYVQPLGLQPEELHVYYGSIERSISKILTVDELNTIIPVDGDCIIAMPKVAGGNNDGAKALRTVASLAITFLSFGAGSAVAGGAWAGSGFVGASSWGFWSYAAAIGVQVAGGLLLSHFMPQPDSEESKRDYSFGTLRNMTGERNPMPLHYGENRFGGQIISKYVSTDGERNYYNVLIAGGYGPIDYIGNGEYNPGDEVDNVPGISDIEINGQPISNYGDNVKVWKRAGLNSQSIIPNFNDQIVQQFPGYELTADGWPSYTVTTDGTGEGIEVIFSFPAGLQDIHRDGDDPDPLWIDIKIEYKLHADTEWTTWETLRVERNTSNPFRVARRKDNLTLGQYDVRCQVVGIQQESDLNRDTCIWEVLSCITYDDLAYPNVPLLGIQALATDLLNGTEPTVTAIWKRSYGWVWNPYTEQYEQKPMTNPAWGAYDMIHQIYRYKNIRTGEWVFVVEGARVSRSDYQAFVDWAEFCDRKNLKCNYVHYEFMQLNEAVKPFEEVGRGRVFIAGTKYTCVFDAPVDTPAQMFVASNTELNSYSKEIVSRNERATCIEVTFRNKDNGYEQETITVPGPGYDDPDVQPNPISISLVACTDYEQAYREGYYRLLVNHYINETINHKADIDSIQCRVGDVYAFCRNKINGKVGGRIVDVGENWVKLDRTVTIEGDKKYALRVRLSDGSQTEKYVATSGGSACFGMALQPSTTITTDVIQLNESFSLDRVPAKFVDSTHFSVDGDYTGIFVKGITVELDYKYHSFKLYNVVSSTFVGGKTIVEVVPQYPGNPVPEDLFRVRWAYTMPDVGDIYAFGESETVVEYYRMWGITRDKNLRRTITGVKYVPEVYEELVEIPKYTPVSVSRTVKLTVSHYYQNRRPYLAISWLPPAAGTYGGAIIEINDAQVARVDMSASSYIYAAEKYGETTIKVTVLDFFGNRYSVGETTYMLIREEPPSPVTNLRTVYDGERIYLAWDFNDDDIRNIGYEIRRGTVWNESAIFGKTYSNRYEVVSAGTYMVAPYYGQQYGEPREIEVNDITSANVVKRVTESGQDGWLGTHNNTYKHQTTVDDWPNWDMVEDTDADTSRLKLVAGALEGYYTINPANIVDIGTSGKCFIAVNLVKHAPADSLVEVEINVGNDNGVYSGWQVFDSSRPYVGRLFNFRLHLKRNSLNVDPNVSVFEIEIDMPDVVEHKTGIVVSQKTTIYHDKTFHSIPFTVISIQNAQSGDYYELSNETPEKFDIVIKNNNTVVTRTIGYFSRGY